MTLLDAGRNQYCPWSMNTQGAVKHITWNNYYVDCYSAFESVKQHVDILRNLYVATTS